MGILRPVIYNLSMITLFRSLPQLALSLQLFLQQGRTRPELDRLFNSICEKYTELVQLSNIQLPQEWSIPDLIRAVMGNESVIIPGYLESTYYDLFLRGNNSWLFEDLRDFINLINYAPPV